MIENSSWRCYSATIATAVWQYTYGRLSSLRAWLLVKLLCTFQCGSIYCISFSRLREFRRTHIRTVKKYCVGYFFRSCFNGMDKTMLELRYGTWLNGTVGTTLCSTCVCLILEIELSLPCLAVRTYLPSYQESRTWKLIYKPYHVNV